MAQKSTYKILKSPLRDPDGGFKALVAGDIFDLPDEFEPQDIKSDYGNIRMYTIGKKTGRRALVLHGINTTCQSMEFIVKHLAHKGHRVVLFDFYGRGFSDAPEGRAHDAKLYLYQIQTVLKSVRWMAEPVTPENKIKVIGYSMGAAVAMHFVNQFPKLVESIALITPAGMVRPKNTSWKESALLKLGCTVACLILKKKLEEPVSKAMKPLDDTEIREALPDIVEGTDEAKLEKRVRAQTKWMAKNYPGFVKTFYWCLKDAPLKNQMLAFDRLARKGVHIGAFFGAHDPSVRAREYEHDGVKDVLEQTWAHWGSLVWTVLPGDHALPKTNPTALLKALDEFWEGVAKRRAHEYQVD